ncbi:MAG: helix-turn-helix transcriptional regulator [Bacteroidales bacterium]|nr:helix-turn-helix transcriptional regulator [Bacteroidales bacterium]
MKDRILKILDKENISAAKFADVLGVQRSSISHILSGRNKPSLDFVQRILQKFPEINSDWLLFGKGNIYRNGSGQSEQQSQQVATTTEKPKAQPQQPEPQPQPQPANQQQTKPAPAPPQTEAQPVYQQQPQPQAQAQPVFQQPQPQQPRPVDILQTNPDRIIVFYSNNTFAWYSPMNNSQPQPQGVYQ